VDVQERLMAAMPRRAETLSAVDRLIRAAKILNLPTLVTLQYVKGLGPLCTELADSTRDSTPIEKLTFSCCGSDEFNSTLKKLTRPKIILCGVETHVCVQQTALDLIAEGIEVYIAADAVSSRRDADAHISLERLRHAGAIVTTVESIVFELLQEAGTPLFKQILPLFK
jgi:Isochorismatase family